MPMKLTVVEGPDKGRVYQVCEGYALLLGRSRHANTTFNDMRISRVHCEVDLRGNRVFVTDLDSNGGTFINGKRVGEAQIKPGDVINIGDTHLRLDTFGIHEDKTLVPPPRAEVLTSERLGELRGKRLSHFDVGDVVAKAQSGLVFKAHDFKGDRTVALKVLWPEFSKNEDEMARFVRAMQTMMPLRHEHLVALHGAGKTGPYCWVAMEFVEGESLTQVIERIGAAGMLDWRTALRVAVHVARALKFAHDQTIIHRNITPQNILVQSSDKTAKLGDLMLAKAQEGGLAEQITKPGQMLGDVRYMSPERTTGATNIDGRSDIYSLGATVYALLTGRVPCEGKSLVETLQKIRGEVPALPKKFQMSIPDLFQGIVMKMLSKRPEERHQTATLLLADLDKVIKYQGVKV
ncbi:MAG: FHA domain-containing protein [Planctomycetes bacterium]|nr:FHA domain-containing protein [Planctomycetota bacterium]